ncbi:MAG: chemotaxis protein CheW [Proteobacteria bacterium]|nr:chemotaxis protein CheW [Pseudomonadota bacterium]
MLTTGNSASLLEGGQINLACFEVGGRMVALDVAQVREIVRWQEVTPMPKAPELIEGVIDLRGQLVPVLDLSRALTGQPAEVDARTRVVVLETDGLVLGLAVEAAVDVLSVEAGALEDPPALVIQAGYDAVRAVVRRPGESPVLVLSLDHIIESVYRSALPQREESQ